MTRACARGGVVLAEQLQLVALGGCWLVCVIVREVWDQSVSSLLETRSTEGALSDGWNRIAATRRPRCGAVGRTTLSGRQILSTRCRRRGRLESVRSWGTVAAGAFMLGSACGGRLYQDAANERSAGAGGGDVADPSGRGGHSGAVANGGGGGSAPIGGSMATAGLAGLGGIGGHEPEGGAGGSGSLGGPGGAAGTTSTGGFAGTAGVATSAGTAGWTGQAGIAGASGGAGVSGAGGWAGIAGSAAVSAGAAGAAGRAGAAGSAGAAGAAATTGVLPSPVAIATGWLRSCALLAGGQVKCWGENGGGFLGLGDSEHRGDDPGEMGDALPAVDLGTGATAVAVASGQQHHCALLAGGAVKCWGNNYGGALGVGDSERRGDEPNEMGDQLPAVELGGGRTATAVVAGNAYCCALLDDGSVKCWGGNGGGELGLGDTDDRGDEPGEMGDQLPVVQLGAGRTATALTAQNRHTCALLDDGSIKCWGNNQSGQLGLGDTEARGDDPGEMGDQLPAVELGSGRTALAVSAGNDTTCALLDDGSIKCWGAEGGRLGLGDTAGRGDDPNEMGDQLPPVDLGTGATAVAVTSGGFHTCAELATGAVKCWGGGDYGALGNAAQNTVGDSPDEMGDALPPVDVGSGLQLAVVSAGLQLTCAVFSQGQLKCWGRNEYGELGLGDTEARGDDLGEMGDTLPFVDLGQ